MQVEVVMEICNNQQIEVIWCDAYIFINKRYNRM